MNYILSTERLEMLSHSSENQVYSGDLVAELASRVQLLQADVKRQRVENERLEARKIEKLECPRCGTPNLTQITERIKWDCDECGEILLNCIDITWYQNEMLRLIGALELIRDSLPKHSGDWCRLIAEEAVGEK